MERGSERDVALDAAHPRYRRTEEKQLERAESHGEHSSFRTQRARVGHDTAFRRRHAAKLAPSWLSGSSWPRVVALVLAGTLVAVAAIVAAQRLLPERALVSAPSATVVEPEPPQGEQTPVPPESDVARERAALDALPEQ